MTEPSDPTAPPITPAPEVRRIAGRYRLGPVIGRGGMATIHQATDERLGREIAIKLLRPEVTADPDLAQRFRREALAATVLRHPNIVACLDTGTDGDQPFLVMDLIDGEDLAARLKRSGRLAPWQVARIGLDIARGIGVAHIRGIVHRDVKPANILLAADGRAMVTDFGIARLAADAEASMPGTTLGSVHYFSPEQARGATTTPASDVYGLGLVMFEALTGQRAWSGATTDAIALARVGATPPAPRGIRPEIPPALEAVVLKALSPEAADRYPNGAAMAVALEPIVAGVESDGDTTSVVAASPVGVATSGASGSPLDAQLAPPLIPLTSMPLGGSMATAAAAGAGWAGTRPGSGGAGGPPRSGGASAGVEPRPPRSRARRATPAFAVAILALAGIVVGVVSVAALPGDDGAGAFAPAASPTATPTRRPTPSPEATTTPTATPTGAPAGTATPEPTAAPPPPGVTVDLCESFFGIPCGLDPARYLPSRLAPALDFELGEGWSLVSHEPDLVVLTRPEGSLTIASGVTDVFPDGVPETTRGRARDLIESFINTDGVASTSPARVRIDGRRGFSVDLTTTDGERPTLFATDASSYALQPGRTTRLVAIDLPGDATILLAIEPADGSTLRDLLDTADDVAGSMRFR